MHFSKILAVSCIVLSALIITACNSNKTESTISSKSNYSDSYTSKNSLTSNNIEHYCEADGCTKEGVKKYTGISGQTEYYCITHYNEIMDTFGKMESDVGAGAYSKHTCEECSKEGTYSIIGISGETEYYCTEHYYELKELLDKLS